MQARGEFAMKYLLYATIICALVGAAMSVASAAPAQQKTFPSPDAAVNALKAALQAHDAAAIRAIFGPQMEALRCADPADDVRQMEEFGRSMGQLCNLVWRTGECALLYVGSENFPFPIPLVYRGGGWQFDTATGVAEILARRVGANELSAIEFAHRYRAAQLEFAQADCCGGGRCAYAQKFLSDPGTHSGLFPSTTALTTVSISTGLSCLCPAAARPTGDEGQTFTTAGYVFKILKAQGPAAPGGRRSYVVDGNMVGGFALAAYPVCWGTSGVMSFLMGPDGLLYQRNLGASTASWGENVAAFDPGPGWCLVQD